MIELSPETYYYIVKEYEESGTTTALYDVVLMDITMPVMSGDEAVKKLRGMNWRGVVIALTANAMESDRDFYLSVGMDAVVTKPFQMSQLRTVIASLLDKNKTVKLVG